MTVGLISGIMIFAGFRAVAAFIEGLCLSYSLTTATSET